MHIFSRRRSPSGAARRCNALIDAETYTTCRSPRRRSNDVRLAVDAPDQIIDIIRKVDVPIEVHCKLAGDIDLSTGRDSVIADVALLEPCTRHGIDDPGC